MSSDGSSVDPCDDDALNQAIINAASSPSMVTTDEGTVKERSINELIEAQRFRDARCRKGKLNGIRMQVHKSPGTP
jgi:hypothetical protein